MMQQKEFYLKKRDCEFRMLINYESLQESIETQGEERSEYECMQLSTMMSV